MSERSSRFITTRWTQVIAARDKNSPECREALEALCRAYRSPLYAYARRSGLAPHDADDATQAFFAKLLRHDWLDAADPTKGRFRTFLAVAMKRFLANERDRASALKRGGMETPLAPDEIETEERRLADTALPPDPDEAFDRRWARTLLDGVMASLKADYVRNGEESTFECLKNCLVAGRGEIPYAGVAARAGLSEGAARVAVSRMRKRFRDLFREAVAATVADAGDIDAESRHIARVLAEG